MAKKYIILVFSIFCTCIVSAENNIPAGWYDASVVLKGIERHYTDSEMKQVSLDNISTLSGGENRTVVSDNNQISPMAFPLAASEAHPDLQKLVDSLEGDPNKIISYVNNEIKNEIYYGVKKGAVMTYYDGSGNDYDRAVLIMELLRIAGLSQDYYFGMTFDVYFFNNIFGSFSFLNDYLGVDESINLGEAANKGLALDFLTARKIPYYEDNLYLELNGSLYQIPVLLIPSFKIYKMEGDNKLSVGLSISKMRAFAEHVNVAGSVGINFAEIYNTVSGNISGAEVTDLDEDSLKDKLKEYSARLSKLMSENEEYGAEYLTGNIIYGNPRLTLDIMTVRLTNPSFSINTLAGSQFNINGVYGNTDNSTILSKFATDKYLQINSQGKMALILYKTIPQEHYSKLYIHDGDNANASVTKKFSELDGDRLWLYFSGDTGYLKYGDSTWFSKSVGSSSTLYLNFNIQDGYDPLFTSNSVYNEVKAKKFNSKEYFNKGNTFIYNLSYGFNSADKMLARRQLEYSEKLKYAKSIPDNFDEDGNLKINSGNLSDSQRDLIAEGLNIMGLNWINQTSKNGAIIGNAYQCYTGFQYRMGRVAQESAFYIDFRLQVADNLSSTMNGDDEADLFYMSSFFESAFEHGVIQQQQSGSEAISTVNIFHYANSHTPQSPIVTLTSAADVDSLIPSYSSGERESVKALFNSASDPAIAIVLPKNRSCLPDDWDWKGYAYVLYSSNSIGMMISSGQNGGYGVFDSYFSPNYTFDQSFSIPNYSYTNYSAPSVNYNVSVPSFSIPNVYSWDPVDMYSGAYVYEKEDISISNTLNFVRMYNSNLNEMDSSGLGYGWTHNYDITATPRSSWEACLGYGTAEQMSSFAVSVYAAKEVFSRKMSPGECAWMTATVSLIAKWGVDEMYDNAVSIKMGKESMQFVKQYRNVGTDTEPVIEEYFAPPAGTNLKLVKNQELYELSEPFGNTYYFNTNNKIDKIRDIAGKEILFSYDDNGKLVKVKDFANAEMVLTWQDGHISSVSIGGRSVSYAYTGSLLSSVTDPLGKIWKYEYNSQDRIEYLKIPSATGDQYVVKNIYNDSGNVIEQWNANDSQKSWKYQYIGTKSREIDPYGNIREFRYNDRGICESSIDQLGGITKTEYDGQIRLVKKTLPNGNEVRYTYDSWHNKLSEDIYEKQADDSMLWKAGTLYVYENDSERSGDVPRLKSTVLRDAENSSTGRISLVNGYASIGGKKTLLPASVTDERGVASTYSYDSQGWLTSENIGGRTTSYSNFNAYGNPQSITYPNGLSDVLEYNSAGDLHKKVSKGITTVYTYDAMRRPIGTSSTGTGVLNAVTTSMSYDHAGNVETETDPDGIVTKTQWSPQQKKLSVTVGTGENAQTTSYTYDFADRLVSTTLPDGKTVSNVLDAAGRTLSTTSAGLTTTYEYDSVGQTTKVTSHMGKSVSYTYDALGNKTSMTDARGNTVFYTYNSFGEQTELKNRNGNIFRLSTNLAQRYSEVQTPLNYAAGRSARTNYASGTWDVSSVVSPSGATMNFSYDSAGRVSATSGIASISYSYDANTGLLKSLSEDASSVNYGYDGLGRVNSTISDNLPVLYTYTAGGKIKTITYPAHNGIAAKTVTYNYDDLGRMQSVTDWEGRVTSYSYDSGNRLVSIARSNGTFRNLSYDNAGRLLEIRESAPVPNLGSGFSGQRPIMLYKFGYDGDSRISNLFRAPIPEKLPRASFSAAYNADNQLTSFKGSAVSYDMDGNMTAGPISETDNAATYSYDSRNRLSSAGGVSYSYDVENNRKSVSFLENGKDVKYTFVYDRSGDSSNVLSRTKTVSEGTNVISQTTTFYVYGAGLDHEITFDSEGNEVAVKYYHYDQVGSTIAMTDGNGAVTDRFSYDVWGYSKHVEGSSDTPFKFIGIFGVQSDSNGLINMRARYYNPTTMSFITADPSGFEGGFNWYLYANGNPLMNTDSTGYWFGLDDLIAAGIGAILGTVGQVIADVATGEWSSWQTYAGSAVGGAVGGWSGLYTFNPYAMGAVAGATSNFTTQGLNWATGVQDSFDVGSLATDTTVGAMTGFIPGTRQIVTSAGRGSYSAITKQMTTKAMNGTAKNISASTAFKMGATANNNYNFLKDPVAEIFNVDIAVGSWGRNISAISDYQPMPTPYATPNYTGSLTGNLFTNTNSFYK